MRLVNDAERSAYKNIWVIAEQRAGAILPVTRELLGAARDLAAQRGAEVWAVAPGAGAAEGKGLFPYGADTVIVIDDRRLACFNDELEANVLDRLIRKYRPEVVLGAATARGRALIPRLAVRTESGLTADCTGLGIDPENGDLLQTRPAFGGNIMATIRCSNHRPQMATVRPRVMRALPPDPSRSGRIISETIEAAGNSGSGSAGNGGDAGLIKKVLGVFKNEDGSAVNLSDAKIIVSGGRAMKGPEGFKVVQALADAVGGAVGASRAAVDAGWIAYPHQVGQTGQTVQTAIYVACGISGQIQHLVGMQSCDTIIAIDKNPDTPMMQLADIAITGDLFEIVPAIVEGLKRAV
jgi:electron transfer flavoprotein alpha subunit